MIMKKNAKTNDKPEYESRSYRLSAANITKLEQFATIEARGNRSAWLDNLLTETFAGRSQNAEQ